jgi:class 3 adenylate cyclase
METPETRYALSGKVHVAYQTIGAGPLDIVVGMPWVSHLAVNWEDAPNAQFFQDLSSIGRVILFDKRGVGLSDRDVGIPTVEERMDDFRAVMDAADSKRAVVVGISESGAMSLVFAAAHPERAQALVLIGGYARRLRGPDYPWGLTQAEFDASIVKIEREWGTAAYADEVIADLAPNRKTDPVFRRWVLREMTYGASPSSAVALEKMFQHLDVRSVLPAIHVPVLVLAGDARTDVAEGKYIASRIPSARFAELPVREHLYFASSEGTAAAVRLIREFVAAPQRSTDIERILTTVLFTDIVESTQRASDLGDASWSRLLEQFYDGARAEITRFRGRLIKTTGDGVLAIFDGPTRAVRCAGAMRAEARRLGIEIRAGLHTGECVVTEHDVHGIAVHIASRVNGLATGNQVLLSGTVRDLSVGSDLRFEDQGVRTLRGVEGEWRVYRFPET